MVAPPRRPGRWFLLPLILLAVACDRALPPGPSAAPDVEEDAELATIPPEMAADPPGACRAPPIWDTDPISYAPPPISEPVRNTLSIDAQGRTWFNNVQVDSSTLREYLQIMGQMVPSPQLDVRVDPGASCAAVYNVVRTADEFLTCERDCTYEQAPVGSTRPQTAAEENRSEDR